MTSPKDKAKAEHEVRDKLLYSASLELNSVIERAIRDLPPRDLLLLDYRAAGRPWADVAQELGMTEAAVRQQWVRTKERIRTALRREHLIHELTGNHGDNHRLE